MNSAWSREVRAILLKEWRSERRNSSATVTALMLSGATVFTLAFAFFGRKLTAEATAGMLWAALLLAGVSTLMRSLVAEDELGTGDLLRLWARPHAVYWGKACFAFLHMVVTAAVATLLFLMLTGTGAARPLLLVLVLIGGSLALAGTITLVSAIISRADNRGTLGGVVALPMLVPLVALGVNATRAALDSGALASSGWTSCLGLYLYTLAVLALAPYQFASIWGEP
jgi:heme exporter protein B